MATEVSDPSPPSTTTPDEPQEQSAVITVTPSEMSPPSSPPPPSSPTESLHKLIKEVLSVLETQEAELYSIACTDVNETAQAPLARAKASNKGALQKLAEVMDIIKHIPIEDYTQEREKAAEPDITLNHSLSTLPLSPILRASESKVSPPSSPSKSYFHTLSSTFKHSKRLSLGGTSSRSADLSTSGEGPLTDRTNHLSMSMGCDSSFPSPKHKNRKERKSITNFLTLRPQRTSTMTHSSSTPTLETTVRTEIVTPYPSMAATDRRSASLPPSPIHGSPLSPNIKHKEKLQPDDVYTLHIHETSRMLFEKKRNLMQQHSAAATDISA